LIYASGASSGTELSGALTAIEVKAARQIALIAKFVGRDGYGKQLLLPSLLFSLQMELVTAAIDNS
jgi:hypothetical protein